MKTIAIAGLLVFVGLGALGCSADSEEPEASQAVRLTANETIVATVAQDYPSLAETVGIGQTGVDAWDLVLVKNNTSDAKYLVARGYVWLRNAKGVPVRDLDKRTARYEVVTDGRGVVLRTPEGKPFQATGALKNLPAAAAYDFSMLKDALKDAEAGCDPGHAALHLLEVSVAHGVLADLAAATLRFDLLPEIALDEAFRFANQASVCIHRR